jgi:TRAP-type C4-dicarboxylate transport system permease small subunit
MYGIKRVMNYVHLFMGYLAILQLVVMVILISVQVFCRYVLNFSIPWVEEVSLLLMVWFSFIAMAIGVRNKLHISIELFVMWLPKSIQKGIIARIADLSIILIGFVLVYHGILLVQNGMMSTLPATGLPAAAGYAFVPITGVLITYDAVMDFFGLEKEEDLLEKYLRKEGEAHA